jgi:hypothetical protein
MKRVLVSLWPPYGVYLSQKDVARITRAQAWSAATDELAVGLASIPDAELNDAERVASQVVESEVRRKDTLEAKAATFVGTPALAAAITAAIAPLTRDLKLSTLAAVIVTALYLVALFHLLVSAWYAVSARRVEALVVLSAFNGHRLLVQRARDRIAERLAYAKVNEPALILKANRLTAAEDLFLRGLAFFACASSLTVMSHLLKL